MALVEIAFFVGGQPIQAAVFHLVPVFCVFWIGSFFFRGAMRFSFEKTLLSVDSESVVLKSILFGRIQRQELALNGGGECQLVPTNEIHPEGSTFGWQHFSTQQVDAIGITNGDKTFRFGSNLSQEDKQWLADEIRHRLAQVRAGIVPHAEIQPLTVPQLPAETPIRVLEESAEGLSFWLPLVPDLTLRVTLFLIVLTFSCFWLGGLALFVWPARQGGDFDFAFALIPAVCVFGLPPIGVTLFVGFGRTTVRLTPEKLSCRWSLGPFGRQSELPVRELEAIDLGPTQSKRSRSSEPTPLQPAAPRGRSGGLVAVGHHNEVELAFELDPDLSEQMAGLLKEKLAGWGCRPPVRWVYPQWFPSA